eukprot:CAMPEP_0113474304 /NCGR_PEP_ID=MMETSP0014_2-20120614/18508_1 /TAXON_ID=2857 /ORGANISM="Nitzschia sp." /LENGTH=465 /DNA_ID=CAMNT_0000367133 /DNA_START=203 /DNA_END=1600 /DNA_ORIENTATION=- /assembly_acc=CAM_ASM_000159
MINGRADGNGDTVDATSTTVEREADSDDNDGGGQEQKNNKKSSLLLSLLGEDNDVFDNVLEFLDTRSLARFDGCCRLADQKSTRTWSKICTERMSTVSRARAELDAMMKMMVKTDDLDGGGSDENTRDGNESTRRRTNESKRQAILYERLQSFCHKIESLYVDLISTDQQESRDTTSAGATAVAGTTATEISQSTSSSSSALSRYFDKQVFREPEAFIFYVKMTNRNQSRHTSHSSSSSATSTTITNSKNSKDDRSSYEDIVHWEGLVSALDQGGWGSTSILFFHLRELGHKLRWTPEMEKVLQYQHGDHQSHHPSIDNQEYQEIVKNAFQNFVLVMVAIPKHDDHSQLVTSTWTSTSTSTSRPRLVVATNGHHFVSHDNRIYFHIPSRQYYDASSTCQSPKSHEENNGGDETAPSSPPPPPPPSSSSVYPRLVTSEAVDENTSGELFGIRIVCNIGDDGHGGSD